MTKKVVKHNPICVFEYLVMDLSDVMKSNGVGVQFTDEQLIAIADFVEEHGGVDNVKVNDLPKEILDIVENACKPAWQKDVDAIDVEPDGEFYMILVDQLPVELQLACDAINASAE